jgi:hypothetical protein
MKFAKLSFLVIILFSFFLGMYLYTTGGLNELKHMESMQGTKGSIDVPQNFHGCPNLLIKKGNTIMMYNTKQSLQEGINPILFNSMDQYIQYYNKKKQTGSNCSILFLQEEYDTQGNQVYRVRGSPFDLGGGLSQFSILNGDQGRYIVDRNNPIPVENSTLDNPPFNHGMYQGIDTTSQYQGRYTEIDKIHDSTMFQEGGSLNAADPNWAGVLATQDAIQRGVYDENNVSIHIP